MFSMNLDQETEMKKSNNFTDHQYSPPWIKSHQSKSQVIQVSIESKSE